MIIGGLEDMPYDDIILLSSVRSNSTGTASWLVIMVLSTVAVLVVLVLAPH